jgi:hypothetical protein
MTLCAPPSPKKRLKVILEMLGNFSLPLKCKTSSQQVQNLDTLEFGYFFEVLLIISTLLYQTNISINIIAMVTNNQQQTLLFLSHFFANRLWFVLQTVKHCP